MKILIIGRGVISTQYGWALEQAGNDVTFYVRPGRINQYGDIVNLKILDGRENKKGNSVNKAWKIKMIEELSSNHDFELIMISVNHNQLSNIINWLEPLVNNSTVLMFNNIIDEPLNSIGSIPKEQVVWGFPGAGGSFINQNTLDGGFMKKLYKLEQLEPLKEGYTKEAMECIEEIIITIKVYLTKIKKKMLSCL